MTGGGIDFCWVHRRHRRSGELVVALWINWKVPVGFWDLSEGVGMLGKAGGGLEKEIGC